MKKTWEKCLGILVSAGTILSLAACSGAQTSTDKNSEAETESTDAEASSEANGDQTVQYASASLRINENKGAVVTVTGLFYT